MKTFQSMKVFAGSLVALLIVAVGCSKPPSEEKASPSPNPSARASEQHAERPDIPSDDPAEQERHEAAKKRMAEIIVETIRLRKRNERNPDLQKEGDELIRRLTNDDHSRENAVLDEIVRQYAPEQYDDVKAILEKNRGMQTQARLHNIRTALEQYMMDQGKYPEEGEGLGLLIQRTDRRTLYLDGGEESIKDSWGNPLIYRLTNPNAYTIKSVGPDGMEGTADDVELK